MNQERAHRLLHAGPVLLWWSALLLIWGGICPAAAPVIPERIAEVGGNAVSGEEMVSALLLHVAQPPLAAKVMRTFVRHQVFRQAARAAGLTVSAEDVAQRLTEWEEAVGGREALERENAAGGLRWYRLEAAVEDALLIDAVAHRVANVPRGTPLQPKALQDAVAEVERTAAVKLHGLGKPVVATVAGSDLVRADLIAFLVARLKPALLRAEAVQLVGHKLVLAEAAARGLKLTPLDEEKALGKLRRGVRRDYGATQGGVAVTLEGLLQGQGRTLDDLRGDLSFRANAFRLKMLAPQLTEEALRACYENERELYRIVRAQHVLFAYDERNPYGGVKAPIERRDAVLVLAREVWRGLQTDDGRVEAEAFARAVEKYSYCPSRAVGGDLGYLARSRALATVLLPAAYGLDRLVGPDGQARSPIRAAHEAVLEAVFALEEGMLSAPVVAPYGVHLIWRQESRLPQNWDGVRELVYDRQVVAATAALMKTLPEKHQVRWHWRPWRTASAGEGD